MRTKLLLALMAALGIVSTPVAQGQKEPGLAAVAGELLVRFKADTSKAAIGQVHSALGSGVLSTFQIVPNLQLVRFPASVSLSEARKLYEKDPNVLYAEPNYVRAISQQITLTPDDPQFNDLWAMNNTGQTSGTPDADIDAPEAWEITTGSSEVVVAIIDTGVDYNHPDLAANMWRNTVDCNSNNIDDDGNGFIDDCYGIDTVNNDANPMDDHNHGSHVAGIIGARGNNGVGVVGVNWNVRIMACKFLGANGSGTTAGAIACLQYVKLMKDRGVNVVATNNSWGGGGFSQALYDAIAAHMNAGILFVAAAGNSSANNDTGDLYPANYYLPNVIAVAATTDTDALATFSNFGQRTVHVGAPGRSILSTTRNNTYSTFNGTSMAAPHVTGLAALIKAQDLSRDWIAIRNLILSSGDLQAALQHNTATGRRINAHQALTCLQAPAFAVLRPLQLGGSAPVTIAVLNIDCAAPAGSLTVTINPGGTVVALQDNGSVPDLAANDGIYSGIWNPSICQVGTFALNFSNGQSATVQIGGSQGSYSCTTPPLGWRTITGTNLNLGDDQSSLVNPGFPVRFGTRSYTTVHVGANGVASLTDPVTDFSNTLLPNPAYATLIAPFWDDLFPVPRSNNNVFWKVLRSAPNRELVIEWRNVGLWACQSDATATVRFQIVLFESSNAVLFNYWDVSFGGACAAQDKGSSATIGIQIDGADATQIGFNAPILGDRTAVLWNAAAPPPGTADLMLSMTDHPDPVTVGSNLTYTITITNNGPDAASGASLTNTLPAGVNFVSATPGTCAHTSGTVTCTLGTLANGASTTITVVVMPRAAGIITNAASVSAASSDPELSNNSATESTTVNPGSCAGVTVAMPAAVSYTPTATRPARRSIRLIFRNASGTIQTVRDIVPLPEMPFTIVTIRPALPNRIPNKRSYTLVVVTERAAGLGPATATAPYFNIAMDCGLLTGNAGSVPLQFMGMQAELQNGQLHIEARGAGIASLRVQLYDLTGRLVAERTGAGSTLTMPLTTDNGRRLANGLYLYLVTVRGVDEQVVRSEVRKLLLLR